MMNRYLTMDADIHTLYDSDFYRVMDFKCRCTDCRTSKPEYGEAFCISFVRKGNFLFNVFRHSLDSYTGCVLISKPEYERTVTHTHTVPDECTIFEFKKDFYRQLLQHYGSAGFFRNNDLHSTLIRTGPETEFLHSFILQSIANRSAGKLLIDGLVIGMIGKVLGAVTDHSYQADPGIDMRLKKNHLVTIERAKEYMTSNFMQDISLMAIAEYCYVSLFHFSRLFKKFTSRSPHQYLLAIRLQNAALLLRTTEAPIADISFSSGFGSIEYFTAAFRQKYNCPPGKYRMQKG